MESARAWLTYRAALGNTVPSVSLMLAGYGEYDTPFTFLTSNSESMEEKKKLFLALTFKLNEDRSVAVTMAAVGLLCLLMKRPLSVVHGRCAVPRTCDCLVVF